MSETVISSCCKINLFLQVTGRRSDGYHTLQTLFLPVKGVADSIVCDFDCETGLDVSVSKPGLPSGKGNIIYRAAECYAQMSGITPSWKFVLDKHVPVTAGLGGGSSNAAAVLKALNERYKALNSDDLHDAAAKIGADVPFFLDAVPAWADGIGDKLEKVDGKHPPLHIVLVNPGFPVGVRWSYGQLDASKFCCADLECRERLTRALIEHDVETMSMLCRNDLGTALFMKFPLLSLLKNSMLSAGASCVQVSGSGPTLFAVCSSAEVRTAVAEQLRCDFSSNSGMRIFECEV